MSSNPNDLISEIQSTLRSMAEAGCRGFDPKPESIEILNSWGAQHDSLDAVRNDLADCRRCPLAASRNHLVFGEGNPRARLMFIGEGPGYEEDRKGAPFVGPAGDLLTKIIQAMGLTRDQVYICNVVKCRPPKNRNPLPEEIQACLPFLQRQIDCIRPEFICTLGSVAVQSLLQTTEAITRLRGRFQNYQNIPVMPTFHPAYLLRNPDKKREVWDDIQKLMKEMGQKTEDGR